jgi:CYTH domain-containing protein
MEIELERTFLAKHLPLGLSEAPHKEIIDVYFPKQERHPNIRIRKNGDKLYLTKKSPIEGRDSSKQLEQTINLSDIEFNELLKLDGKKARKIRYYFKDEHGDSEWDIFQDDLKGLVLVDFEFKTEADKESFVMPDYCLAEVTQDEFVAGGFICGKSYSDIRGDLSKFNYQQIEMVI